MPMAHFWYVVLQVGFRLYWLNRDQRSDDMVFTFYNRVDILHTLMRGTAFEVARCPYRFSRKTACRDDIQILGDDRDFELLRSTVNI